MEYRMLGELRISVVGLGCRRLTGPGMDYQSASRVVHAALDTGIVLFDTADSYGRGAAEEVLGKALRPHRHEVLIATKVGLRRRAASPDECAAGLAPEITTQDGTASYLVRAAEESLRRLGTDYIDLLQLHYPDPATPPEETARALSLLVRQGKARAVGLCNFPPALVQAWVDGQRGWPEYSRPLTLQVPYNLAHREEEPGVELARQNGMGVLACMPLLMGYLAREPRPGDQEGDPDRSLLPVPYVDRLARAVARMRQMGRDWGLTPAQMALRWAADRPGVVAVLAGATRPEQVRENATLGPALPEELRSALDEISGELGPLPPLPVSETVVDSRPSAYGDHYVLLGSGLKVPAPAPLRAGQAVEVDGWRGKILRAVPPGRGA